MAESCMIGGYLCPNTLVIDQGATTLTIVSGPIVMARAQPAAGQAVRLLSAVDSPILRRGPSSNPAKAVHRRAACHIPLQASKDFGTDSFEDSGELKVHSHQIPAANTVLPRLLGVPKEVTSTHQGFLSGAPRVDVFGIKDDGTITGPLSRPVRPQAPRLVPGM